MFLRNPYEYYREPSALILRSSVDRYVKKIKALNADDPKLRKRTLKIREKQQAEMKKRSSVSSPVEERIDVILISQKVRSSGSRLVQEARSHACVRHCSQTRATL